MAPFRPRSSKRQGSNRKASVWFALSRRLTLPRVFVRGLPWVLGRFPGGQVALLGRGELPAALQSRAVAAGDRGRGNQGDGP